MFDDDLVSWRYQELRSRARSHDDFSRVEAQLLEGRQERILLVRQHLFKEFQVLEQRPAAHVEMLTVDYKSHNEVLFCRDYQVPLDVMTPSTGVDLGVDLAFTYLHLSYYPWPIMHTLRPLNQYNGWIRALAFPYYNCKLTVHYRTSVCVSTACLA